MTLLIAAQGQIESRYLLIHKADDAPCCRWHTLLVVPSKE